MAFPPEKFPKEPGDLILHQDFNGIFNEIKRLESDKVNRSGGDAISGSLSIDGSVGIGTTEPKAKLEVSGSIKLAWKIFGGSDDILSIYQNTNADDSRSWIELWGNHADRAGELTLTGTYIDFRYGSDPQSSGNIGMRLSSDGNVGIGTTEPGKGIDHRVKLDLSENGVNNLALRAGDESNYLFLVPNLDDGGFNHISRAGDKGLFFKGGNLVIAPWAAPPNAGMKITNAGNVGIGTTDPKGKLHVQDLNLEQRPDDEQHIAILLENKNIIAGLELENEHATNEGQGILNLGIQTSDSKSNHKWKRCIPIKYPEKDAAWCRIDTHDRYFEWIWRDKLARKEKTIFSMFKGRILNQISIITFM